MRGRPPTCPKRFAAGLLFADASSYGCRPVFLHALKMPFEDGFVVGLGERLDVRHRVRPAVRAAVLVFQRGLDAEELGSRVDGFEDLTEESRVARAGKAAADVLKN